MAVVQDISTTGLIAPRREFSYCNRKMALGITLVVAAVALAVFAACLGAAWGGSEVPGFSSLIGNISNLSAWKNGILLACQMTTGTLVIVFVVYAIRNIKKGSTLPPEHTPIAEFAKEILSGYSKEKQGEGMLAAYAAVYVPLIANLIFRETPLEKCERSFETLKSMQIAALFGEDTEKCYTFLKEQGFTDPFAFLISRVGTKFGEKAQEESPPYRIIHIAYAYAFQKVGMNSGDFDKEFPFSEAEKTELRSLFQDISTNKEASPPTLFQTLEKALKSTSLATAYQNLS